jgi:hypothetical protein
VSPQLLTMTSAPASDYLPDALSAPVSAEACQESSNAGAGPDIIAQMVSGRSRKSKAQARGRKSVVHRCSIGSAGSAAYRFTMSDLLSCPLS